MRLPLRRRRQLLNPLTTLTFASQWVLTFYHKNIITGLVLRPAQELLHPKSALEKDSLAQDLLHTKSLARNENERRSNQASGEYKRSPRCLKSFGAWLTFFNERNNFHTLNALYWLMMAMFLMDKIDKVAAAQLQKLAFENWLLEDVQSVTEEIFDALHGTNSGDIFLSPVLNSGDEVQQKNASLILAVTAAKHLELAPLVRDRTIKGLHCLGKAIWGASEWKSVRGWLHSEFSTIMNEAMKDEIRRVKSLVRSRASYGDAYDTADMMKEGEEKAQRTAEEEDQRTANRRLEWKRTSVRSSVKEDGSRDLE